MSSIPAFLRLIDEVNSERYNPYYDFGLGIQPRMLAGQHRHQQPFIDGLGDFTWPLGLLSSQPPQLAALRDLDKNQSERRLAAIGKDGFKVCMNVSQFKPEELNVKIVNNTVVIEGKHEEREDMHGHISRHFKRRYILPSDFDTDKLVSTLSTDGVLTVTAPKPQPIENESEERVIAIQETGAAHSNGNDKPDD